MTGEEAVQIVARHLLKSATAAHLADALIDRWEDYPEVGENDWHDVVRAADKMLDWPTNEAYAEAYELLGKRVEADDIEKHMLVPAWMVGDPGESRVRQPLVPNRQTGAVE